MKLQFTSSLLLFLGACQEPLITANSLPPDASDASAYGYASPACVQACKQIASAGCSEGSAPNCATRLDMAQSNRLVRLSDGSPLVCDVIVKQVHAASDMTALGLDCN